MKQVIVQAFCDGDHAERTPANVERRVSIDGSKSVVLDVCDSCDQMFQVMLGFMERGAVVPDEDADADEEQPQREQRRQPPRKQKGSKQSRPDKAARRQARTTGRDPGNGMITVCPDCGFVSVSRNALGQHLAQKHNKRFGDYTVQDMERAWERFRNMQDHAPEGDTPVAQSA
jgi:hypothetical protein